MEPWKTPVEPDPQDWKKWRRRLLWLVAFGVLLAWVLTWALDSPKRPSLAERDDISRGAVHISGYACGQYSEGSGFLVEPDLVLTNAHVVAGVEEITVSRPGGGSEIGTLVGFDPGRDIAAVRVAGLSDSPGMAALEPVALASVEAQADDVGDVATVDSDEGLDFVPFRVSQRVFDTGRNIYAEVSGGRSVLDIRSQVSRGDSGAALLNHDGEVVGVLFGTDRGEPSRAFALNTNEVVAFLAEIDNAPLPTPPCITR